MISLKGILRKEQGANGDNTRCNNAENKRWTQSIEQRIYEHKCTIELLKTEDSIYRDDCITRISEIILELQAIIDKNRGRCFSPKDENFLLHQ